MLKVRASSNAQVLTTDQRHSHPRHLEVALPEMPVPSSFCKAH